MEDGRKEEAVERAGCDVWVAGGRIPGVEVIADPRHSCFLHSARELIAETTRRWPMQHPHDLHLNTRAFQHQIKDGAYILADE